MSDSFTPRISRISPAAAMPGGEVDVHGTGLGPMGTALPHATISDLPAPITLSRPTRARVLIAEGTISGDLVLHRGSQASNATYLHVAVPMAENLQPVANPAVDADGNVYATLSGPRGQAVPVSIFAISRDFQMRPFAREIMNAHGLAFDQKGYLYCSSRHEGTIYRVSAEGEIRTFAEGLGIATGIAFDREQNLYVGDRSGTIFKIAPDLSGGEVDAAEREIFVFATLEPSMAAYHLAFNEAGTLFVSGPTTSSNQVIHAIDRDGSASVFYSGLGRAQGLAFDVEENLYCAASLHGERGIVRITPTGEASLVVSGSNLVGLCFLEDGNAALATRDGLYHVALDVEGRRLV